MTPLDRQMMFYIGRTFHQERDIGRTLLPSITIKTLGNRHTWYWMDSDYRAVVAGGIRKREGLRDDSVMGF